MELAFPSHVWWEDMRVSHWIETDFFPYEDGQAVEQTAQLNCAFSSLELSKIQMDQTELCYRIP